MKPSPLDIFELLNQHHLRPNKSLGQNFLIDAGYLEKVASIARIEPDDAVLEIGPGLGSLTRWLAMQARRVVAVEVDGALIPILSQVLAPYPNVRVVQGDILAFDPAQLMRDPASPASTSYLVVANIPYYITSALIRHLLESTCPPNRLALTVQREVAERICAAPGEMSLLAISVQVYGKPSLAARIPAGAFYPPPKVDSAVVRVDCYAQPLVPPSHLPTVFRLAKAGFAQKRKTLRNSLAGGMGWTPTQAGQLLAAGGIDPMRRAETLSLEEWSRLSEIVDAAPL